jgi:type IV pilus assembly protein PilY1
MVYVGANDGMLHAFDAQTGRENWAFVPEFALPKFATLADSGYCHTYTCDQTATVADMQLSGLWRTVLASNGREGGASIFAMDITDPASPNVLWQAEAPNGKSFLSEVTMASVGGRAVAMVGSGMDRDEGVTWLYVYDLETGDLIGERKLSDIDGRNKATRPATVDLNLDDETDLVYIADMSGDVWRFETRGDTNPQNWDMTKFFDGIDPITANPVTSYGVDPEIWVYFGTGAYLEDDDMISTGQQYFYAVKDLHDGGTATRRMLADQTGSAVDIGSSRGWWVELWGAVGERVTEQAVVVAENVIFTSFSPSTDVCVAGGESWLYQMAYDTGRNPKSEEDNQNDVRQTSLGEGIASYPVVDLSQGKIVVQSSDAAIKVEPIQADITRLVVKSWQETYENVPDVPAAQ